MTTFYRILIIYIVGNNIILKGAHKDDIIFVIVTFWFIWVPFPVHVLCFLRLMNK